MHLVQRMHFLLFFDLLTFLKFKVNNSLTMKLKLGPTEATRWNPRWGQLMFRTLQYFATIAISTNLKRISTWIYKEKVLDSNFKTKISFFWCGQINAILHCFQKACCGASGFHKYARHASRLCKDAILKDNDNLVITQSPNKKTQKKSQTQDSGHLKRNGIWTKNLKGWYFDKTSHCD